jgi:transposase
MTTPTLPPAVFDALPPVVQAYIRFLEARVGQLEARLADLEARLNQNSSNSSQPPSSDPPSAKTAPPKTPSGKAKGGQPGHPKRSRPELPPDTIVELRAETCDRCDHPLSGSDPEPLTHQVIELPPIRPHVTEYRRHRLICLRCGRVNCPTLPADRQSGYGPRVQALCGLLAGAYRIGKRGIAQLLRDLFGVPISPAVVCKLQHQTATALEPITTQAHAHIAGQPANVDETGWQEGNKRGWLWVAVTHAVTVFLVRLSRGRKVLAELIPGKPGILTTDRYPVYDHLPPDKRQACWAHLRRDFQAMIDRNNAGSGIGEDLLAHADILLRQWKRVRDGTLCRVGFRRHYLGWIRAEVRSLLEGGSACGCAKTAGVCRELLAIEPALYTFGSVEGVEPTNNAAERSLRHAVCWRKTSYGTDSAGGSRFVERVLSVVASCRQQGRNVLTFLTDAIQTARAGTTTPSLIPAHASTP